jgi:benzoate membrane transport protein
MALASALLAGVLARFGLQAFCGGPDRFAAGVADAGQLPGGAALCWPRYAVPWSRWRWRRHLYAAFKGQMAWSAVELFTGRAGLGAPQFSVSALVSLALPLFVVTMASQNLPGVAVHACHRVRHAGVPAGHDDGPGHAGAGAVWRLCAQLQRHHGGDLHGAARPTKTRRSATPRPCPAGAFYIASGLFGAVVAGLLTAFPKELVLVMAGLALLGTIGNGLAVAVKDESHREAALITFLVTLSGVVIGRHRLGLLGRGGRQPGAACATVRVTHAAP